MSINDLSGEVNTLRKNYQLCKTELNSMKKDQAPKPAKDAQKKDEGEAVDPRKALFAAIQNRGTNGDESSSKPAPVDPRKALFVFGAEASNASIPSSNVKYSRGVKRLESFIWKAEASLSLTERDQGTAIEACKVSCGFFYDEDIIHYVLSSHTDCYILFSQDLAKYCGEEGGERAASKLLQNISDFATELKAAGKKYDKRAEHSRRQNAQKNKSIPQKVHKENQVNAALPKNNELLRAQSNNDGNARRAMFAEMKQKLQQQAQKNESIPQKLDKENQVNVSALPKKNQSLMVSSLQPHVGLSDKTKSVSSGPNNTSSESERASAPEVEDDEFADERAEVLAEAAALKKLAVDYMHPEVGVSNVDGAAFGRNYFNRASAPEVEDVDLANERAAVLAEAAALKKLAVDYMHPEVGVSNVDGAAIGRNYFNRASAPEVEDVELANERAAVNAALPKKKNDELLRAWSNNSNAELPKNDDGLLRAWSYNLSETHTQKSSSNDGDARSATFAAIKSQEPVGVMNKARTIDTNIQPQSRISTARKILAPATASVRR